MLAYLFDHLSCNIKYAYSTFVSAMRVVFIEVASLLDRSHIVQVKRETPSPQPFRAKGHAKTKTLEVSSLLAPRHIV
jgi:hypothetical protein